MNREEYLQKAKLTGQAYAEGLYKSWSKPGTIMGPNFKWEEFPEMCGQIAMVSAYTNFSNEEWYGMSDSSRYEVEKCAYDIAFKTAEELLNSGPLRS